MKPRAEDFLCFVAIMAVAFDRLTAGRRTYGAFSSATDRRNLRRSYAKEVHARP